jgi:hypothetical protein
MRFALVLGMVLAIALIIRAMGSPDSQSELTAPIAPKQTIYRLNSGLCSEDSARDTIFSAPSIRPDFPRVVRGAVRALSLVKAVIEAKS